MSTETEIKPERKSSRTGRFLFKLVALLILAGAIGFISYRSIVVNVLLKKHIEQLQQQSELSQTAIVEIKNHTATVLLDVQQLSQVVENQAKALTQLSEMQNVPTVDVKEIYARLLALNERFEKLPLKAKERPPLENPGESPHEEKRVWWKRSLDASWQVIQQLVIVRYNQTNVPPLVTPEQQNFLYQNLQAMVAQATWALLHNQEEIYRMSLQQLTRWIQNYFVEDAPATQAVLNELEQLQQINIHPRG